MPYITCAIRDKEIKLTPEEAVRQLYIYKLMNEYGYAASRIQLETPIHFGREVKRADIAIMDKNRPMVPYIIVELKKPKLTDGKEQLKSYCNATGASIGVWTNGEQISCYNRKDPNFFEEISDIPKATQKLSDIINEKFTYEDLKRKDKISTQKKSLRSLIKEMEDEVLASAGVDSFEEIFKLIFAKLYDELICANDPTAYLQFRNNGNTDYELKEKIQGLFDDAKKKWEGIFTDESKILLSPSHLAVCVASLQDIKLFNNNLDVVDDAFAQELFSMYPISMRKVMDVFPQYFFQTFFQVNREFSYEEKTIDLDKDGNLKERYQVNLHIVDKHILKFYLGISGQFRATKYNESIKKEIDLRPIIRAVVEKHRYQNLIINETQFVHDFYDAVMREISEKLRNYIDITLPKKGFNQTVTGKIKDACLRLDTALRLRFEYNYRYPHEVDPLAASNSYAIIYQVPFNGFGRLDRENIYATRRGEYAPLIATRAVEWFADYVYALRNALFHEIISPLDEEWQAIFKSAYLLLKQVSDICISCISQIDDFPQTQENAVFEYAEKHKAECFDQLADYVEILDFPEMTLSNWKIEKGRIALKGWFSAMLKLQQRNAEAIENGAGSITTECKGFDFSITLGDDFKIATDKETQKEIIEIKLQGS